MEPDPVQDAFANRRIAIIGAAATGLAAAPVLARRGATVVVYDEKPADALAPEVGELAMVAELRLGRPDYPGIEECDLIVPSPGVAADAPVLEQAVRRGTPVLSEIELAYRITRAPIVGITGTNGKTTTVCMAHAILSRAGRDARLAGNLRAGGFTTPLIRAADEASESAWLVAEISSFQLEWVDRFRPRIAVITNITADHLNRHGTRENYVAAKARLLDAQGAGDWTILNLDNDATAGLCGRARGRLLRFSREPHPHDGAWVEARAGARLLRLRLDGAESDVMQVADLPIPGEHTIENALAACCVALAAGCPVAAMASALREFAGVPDRLERVAEIDGVEFVNNTMCTNVDAAVRSIEAYDRPLVVIAGGRDKGSDFTPLGEVIARKRASLVVIGTDGPKIADAARAAGALPDSVRSADTMDEAVRTAATTATRGAVVLLAPACASFDWYTSFEARGEDFKRAVRALQGASGQ